MEEAEFVISKDRRFVKSLDGKTFVVCCIEGNNKNILYHLSPIDTKKLEGKLISPLPEGYGIKIGNARKNGRIFPVAYKLKS